MSLKVYTSHIDANSRAVEALLRIAKIEYEAITVEEHKGEAATEDFKKNVNELGLIPGIAH